MGRHLRIWWPKHHLLTQPSSHDLLFGWFVSSSPASVDIVIALTINETFLSHLSPALEEILQETNRDMPVNLKDKADFCVLGLSAADPGKGSKKKRDQVCGCYRITEPLESCRQLAVGSNSWVQLMHNSCSGYWGENLWLPEVHHIHWKGEVVYHCDVHVIVYETPRHGAHHFSLSYSHYPRQVKVPMKKPKWIKELHAKHPQVDLSTAILAMNSSRAASATLYKKTCSGFYAFIWHALAISAASLSTLFYIIIHNFHHFMRWGSQSWMYKVSSNVFVTAWSNIKIRSCQYLYWPVFLQNSDLRSQPSVEYAEKAALRKHSMWSTIAIDILLGNLIGLSLLYHAEAVSLWFLNSVEGLNNYLRMGSVWLMGVPAGFKLNTELAAILGTTSLNVVQIWSTLWVFVGFFLMNIVRGIAIAGMLFGATVITALMVDMIGAATLHISALHSLIAYLYASQTQALAALWRLFRGQKLNPLRLRLDSYDYTVEQHVVGSLLFTPLLLLLPTTCVFYIFFTIVNTSIRVSHVLVEVFISIIHETPYVKILLWLVRPTRFPAGIWFEIVSCKYNGVHPMEGSICDSNGINPDFDNAPSKTDKYRRSAALVSFLRISVPSIGQIISPHCKKIFTGVSASLVAESAYGVLTGKRISYGPVSHPPSTLPWMHIPIKEYWQLCHKSILSHMADRRCI
ncbi:N-acetylglucosaminyl-phosphatidylinositol biosynthetic protein gpi1 isoform X2 [Rhodamnia argentea]|uniref:N-acetylglucosaminyl-phosphatidylinositol biosynthetic protein gpi1 isoform X2 n=1 Tax=Rhodamnia argentea TaxID=178133 RepID=A0ABM3GTP6_9MYRT|nr:N-acetylglucosaminyl-phosphatidylinositol biosynthetic protein gpi1 isoform X2 [Rhodamnia argentea]